MNLGSANVMGIESRIETDAFAELFQSLVGRSFEDTAAR